MKITLQQYECSSLKREAFVFKKDSSHFSLLSLLRVWSPIQFTDCKNLGCFNTLELFSSLYHLLKIRSSLLFCSRMHLTHNWVGRWIHFSLLLNTIFFLNLCWAHTSSDNCVCFSGLRMGLREYTGVKDPSPAQSELPPQDLFVSHWKFSSTCS